MSSSLKVMDIAKLEKIVEKSKIILIELIDEEIKKQWVILEKEYSSARELIENVENLSKSGLNALNNRSYGDSLKYYEQIINQAQSYNK
jgi:hypothetical protein